MMEIWAAVLMGIHFWKDAINFPHDALSPLNHCGDERTPSSALTSVHRV